MDAPTAPASPLRCRPHRPAGHLQWICDRRCSRWPPSTGSMPPACEGWSRRGAGLWAFSQGCGQGGGWRRGGGAARKLGPAACPRLAATMQASPASRASPMDLRQALFEVAAEHRLDAAGVRRLEQLAGLDGEPVALPTLVPRGVAVLAAALGGLGIGFWVAAQRPTPGRLGRFAPLDPESGV